MCLGAAAEMALQLRVVGLNTECNQNTHSGSQPYSGI